MPLTLIQLISEQTVPNFLPILRLRPERLVHLTTPKTSARANHLVAAARAAGLKPDVEGIELSAMPGVNETLHAVRESLLQARNTGGEAIVNFTGGTKLMSIGAFSAALRERAPSLYVDTQDSCFVDGATSPRMAELLENDWSFTPIRKQLRVDILAIANGVPRVTSGKPWQHLLPLAEHLFQHHADEQATHDALHGPNGLFPNAKEPHNPADWLPVLDRPIALPPTVARLATEAGLVRHGPGANTVLLPDATRAEMNYLAHHHAPDYAARYFAAVAPLQHAAAFLTGGWWEVIVCHAAHQSGAFSDLRWSVQVGKRGGPNTEEDILGMHGVELLYINCKRGGAKARLLPLLEEIRARAATIGGTFNRRLPRRPATAHACSRPQPPTSRPRAGHSPSLPQRPEHRRSLCLMAHLPGPPTPRPCASHLPPFPHAHTPSPIHPLRPIRLIRPIRPIRLIPHENLPHPQNHTRYPADAAAQAGPLAHHGKHPFSRRNHPPRRHRHVSGHPHRNPLGTDQPRRRR
jgi:hypothetical protein